MVILEPMKLLVVATRVRADFGVSEIVEICQIGRVLVELRNDWLGVCRNTVLGVVMIVGLITILIAALNICLNIVLNDILPDTLTEILTDILTDSLTDILNNI